MTDALTALENALHAAGCDPKRRGDKLTARCPSHPDKNPSMSAAYGSRGRDIVVHCHTGCKPDDILAAVNLKWTDFGESNPREHPTDYWIYHDAIGQPLYRVAKYAGKKFRQHALDRTTGEWLHTLGDVERVPYHLPEVLAAIAAGDTIWIAEGEKDVDALVAHGVTATCNPGGAGKFTTRIARHLKGANKVIIVADRDQAGRDHAVAVGWELQALGVPYQIRCAAEGKDAYDHFAFGHGVDEFVDADEAPDDEDVWPDPDRLGTDGTPPAWPRGVLPHWAEAMVDGVADELQAPRDLPGMLAIGMLAIVFGGTAHVRIRGAWREPLNLYTVTALPPSVGKSPAVKLMFGAIIDWLDNERVKVGPDIERAKQQRRMIEGDMAKAERAGEGAQAAAFLDELSRVDVPVLPQLWTDDATPEAYVKRLSEHDGRMSILSTEGGVFQLMAGRYSDQMANLDPYLKAWSGDGIVVDRVGRDSYVIPRPATSIVLTVQPSVLQQVGANTDNRNRGLPARFMMSIPPSQVGKRNLLDAPSLDDDVLDRYNARTLALMEASRRIPDAAVVVLSEAARRRFLEWRQGLEDRRLGDLAGLSEWSTKLESSTVRVAGLLHLADGHEHTDPIDLDAMERAIVLAGYWIEHAREAHQLWDNDSTLAGARAIVARLVDEGVTSTTARDIYRMFQRRFDTVDDLKAPLEMLVDRGWLRSSDPEGSVAASRRGVTSPTLSVHPNAKALWTTTSHVTHVTMSLKDVFRPSSSSSLEIEGGSTPVTCRHGGHVADLSTGTAVNPETDPRPSIDDIPDAPY